MHRLKTLFLMLLFSCIVFLLAVEQASSQDQMRQAASEKLTADVDKRADNLLVPINKRTIANLNLRANRRFEDSLSSADKERIKKILAPDAKIASEYKSFLKQKRTGLFRLLPDFDCDQSRNVIRVDGNCADAIPGSGKYSFRQRNYQLADLFDIKLKDGKLVSKGFLAQGILVEIGDAAIENILSGGNGQKYLLNFVPSAEIENAKRQFAEISGGISTDGFNYTNSIDAVQGKTYILRTTAYRSRITDRGRWDKITPEEQKYFYVNLDKRIDTVVVFRIVKKEADGSLTILWKELSRKKSPEIVFEKNDRLTDIK